MPVTPPGIPSTSSSSSASSVESLSEPSSDSEDEFDLWDSYFFFPQEPNSKHYKYTPTVIVPGSANHTPTTTTTAEE